MFILDLLHLVEFARNPPPPVCKRCYLLLPTRGVPCPRCGFQVSKLFRFGFRRQFIGLGLGFLASVVISRWVFDADEPGLLTIGTILGGVLSIIAYKNPDPWRGVK